MNVSLYENRSVVERMRGLRDLRLARRAVCSGVVCGAKPGVCRAGEEGKGCCPCRWADADEARCARVRCRAERVCRGGENASACCPCARMPSRSEVDAAVQRMNGSSGVHVVDVDVGEGRDGDVAVAAALGAAVAEAEAREARESVLSSDGEVEFDSGAEVDLAGPVKVKRAVSKGGSVARVRGELRVADGYEEEEIAMSEGGEDAAVLGVGGKYAGVQAAGGAVSVEKGVELTSVRAADGGQVRAFGGHTLKLGRGRSEFKGVNGSAGGDVEVAGVSGEGAERVQREAAALRALNGSEASKASMAARAKEVHGEEHVWAVMRTLMSLLVCLLSTASWRLRLSRVVL